MVKKELVMIFISLLLVGIISADECAVKDVSECEDDDWPIVFRMSDLDNAHGETYENSNYNYALCCDFPSEGDPVRSEKEYDGKENVVLKLNQETNAHAQGPNETGYSEKINYHDLVCVLQNDKCYDDDSLEMLSMSSETNAHLSNFSEYDLKLCCGHQDVEEARSDVTSAFWMNMEDNKISEINANPGETRVKLVLHKGPTDKDVRFEVMKDTLWGTTIKEFKTSTDDEGSAEVTWTITQDDLNNIDDRDVIFEVKDDETDNPINKSDYLEIIARDCPDSIVYCEDYTGHTDEEEYCNEDYCDVSDNFADTCGDTWTEDDCLYTRECSCVWNESEGECNFENSTSLDCSDRGDSCTATIEDIGSCKIKGESSGECGDEDDYVEYTWTADWKWHDTNSFTEDELEDCKFSDDDIDSKFVKDSSGDYHYDPKKQSEGCDDGSRNVPCPAAIQLPFFGASTLIGALVVLAVVYYIIYQTQEQSSSKKSRKRKKK